MTISTKTKMIKMEFCGPELKISKNSY